jgi:hypothetical protein
MTGVTATRFTSLIEMTEVGKFRSANAHESNVNRGANPNVPTNNKINEHAPQNLIAQQQ